MQTKSTTIQVIKIHKHLTFTTHTYQQYTCKHNRERAKVHIADNVNHTQTHHAHHICNIDIPISFYTKQESLQTRIQSKKPMVCRKCHPAQWQHTRHANSDKINPRQMQHGHTNTLPHKDTHRMPHMPPIYVVTHKKPCTLRANTAMPTGFIHTITCNATGKTNTMPTKQCKLE